MLNIANSLLISTNSAFEFNKHIVLVSALGLVAAAAFAYYRTWARGASILEKPSPDLKTVQKLAREIQELKPTIGDGASYFFVASHKQYIAEHNTKAGTNSMLAAALKAHAKGQVYGKSPRDVMELGEALLKSRSGQCDHMAAAVVAKIVQHLKNGGKWNSKVEVVGNGAHSFVLIGREGSLNAPETWGKQTILVDTWLSRLGVHHDYTSQITAGDDGVVSSYDDVMKNAVAFEAETRLKVIAEMSADELRQLA